VSVANPADVSQDAALLRFLKAHGLLRRVASGRPFVAALGAPAAARPRREGNVVHLGGYCRLAIRRRSDGVLEIGVLHGRRPDLVDAAFADESARALGGWADLRAACRDLAQRAESRAPAPLPHPGARRPVRPPTSGPRAARLILDRD